MATGTGPVFQQNEITADGLVATPSSGTAGNPVTFSSSYGGTTGTGYSIDWGDKADVFYTCKQSIPVLYITSGAAEKCLPPTLQHAYVTAGTYTATLYKITNIDYATGHFTDIAVGEAIVTITGVNTLPSPTCTLTATPSSVVVGQQVTISWMMQNAYNQGAWVVYGGSDELLDEMIAPTTSNGSQTITLQKQDTDVLGLDIAGPGGSGYGSCSVQITVNY